jgi:hypothetical protein
MITPRQFVKAFDGLPGEASLRIGIAFSESGWTVAYGLAYGGFDGSGFVTVERAREIDTFICALPPDHPRLDYLKTVANGLRQAADEAERNNREKVIAWAFLGSAKPRGRA